MKHWIFSASTALALVLPAQAVFALTPEEVWENWKASATGTGGTITTRSESRNGATLEITGIASAYTDQLSGDSFSTFLDSLTLTAQDDDTVAVTMSDSYRIVFAAKDSLPDRPTAGFAVSQSGTLILASGQPGAVKYDVTVPKTEVRLTDAHDQSGTRLDIRAELTIADLAGQYQFIPRQDGGFAMISDLATGAISATVSGTDPGSDPATAFTGSYSSAGIKSASSLSFPAPSQMETLSLALASGFVLDAKTSVEAVEIAGSLGENGAKGTFSTRLDHADFGADFNREAVAYGFALKGAEIAFDAPGVGAGLPGGEASFSEVSMQVALPVAVSQEAGDFAFLTRLTDLKLSDGLWDLADPGLQFPRDPVTLIVDVAAKAAWLVDIFAEEGGDPFAGGDMPMRVDALDLKEILVKLVGAEANATGALTFDNADLTSFQGFPAPEGTVTINLSGVPALLDRLVAFGIVSADDLMSVRMGLAMLARPGAGPDQLVIGLEFRDKGLFVNGQQIL